MNIPPDVCYAAVLSRDARFDGRFFTAVKTTGIYCRPVCPAVAPRRENVAFYPSAAAAEAAGFRPCLRCRPESAFGSPDWLGPAATVTRALRLISSGALDEGSVDDLAARLHVGSRQLRRLFRNHLGASPTAVAQTRRLLFARQLLTETALPITEIAFASGFSSLRRFNDAMQHAYAKSPREFRRESNGAHSLSGHDLIQLNLTYRAPYDWAALVRFLAARAIPGVEYVTPQAYSRTVRLGDTPGTITIHPNPETTSLTLSLPFAFAPHLLAVTERIHRQFDLGADPDGIAAHLSQDPLLAPAVQGRPGMRIPGAWDGFEVAVRAVLGQQVSVKSANTLAGRLVAAFGEPLPGPAGPELTHLFPTPERLADANLAAIGLPRARAATLCALARAVRDGELDFAPAADLETAVERLMALPGIGPWTAHYVALRALGEPDAFPNGDLALRRAASQPGKTLSPRALEQRAEPWRPWRAYAALHLWSLYLDQLEAVK